MHRQAQESTGVETRQHQSWDSAKGSAAVWLLYPWQVVKRPIIRPCTPREPVGLRSLPCMLRRVGQRAKSLPSRQDVQPAGERAEHWLGG